MWHCGPEMGLGPDSRENSEEPLGAGWDSVLRDRTAPSLHEGQNCKSICRALSTVSESHTLSNLFCFL